VATVIARLVAAALGALALMHVYWASGGRFGRAAAVPEVDGQRAFVPSTGGTLTVAAALFFAAAVVAIARAVGDFRLVGFFKRVRGTNFARLDTAVFAPLCLLLGIAVLYVAYHDV
jgi:hypothetical protein